MKDSNNKVYLRKGNYLPWSASVEVQLRVKKLWKYVAPLTDASGSRETQTSNKDEEGKIEACGIMMKTMTEEPLMLVRRYIGNPRRMWQTLYERYQRSGTQELMILEERLREV